MININGKSYKGKSLSVKGSVIIIDGKVVTDGKDLPKISIVINGDIEKLDVDVCDTIKVKGSVYSLNSTNGDVVVNGNVLDRINTINGDVKCGDVGGSISTVNGDVIKKRKLF